MTSDVMAQGQCDRSPGRNQKQRIERGWRQGDLTRREMRQLIEQQRHIDETRRAMLSDGHLSRREERELERMRKEADRFIYAQRHDGERRRRERW